MTHRSDHERYQHMLGAYVLGGLDPADRAAVDAHVAHCNQCRNELAEFAVVPGLLSRAPEPVAVPSMTPEAAVPEQSPAMHGAVRSLSAARRSRRGRIAASVAGVAAAMFAIGFGIGAVVTPSTADQAPAQRTLALAADADPIGGSADLAAKPWGTEVRLNLHDLPPEERLEVVAIGKDGRSEPAATWIVPEAGRIELTGATSMPQDSVDRIDIRTDDGAVLASSES